MSKRWKGDPSWLYLFGVLVASVMAVAVSFPWQEHQLGLVKAVMLYVAAFGILAAYVWARQFRLPRPKRVRRDEVVMALITLLILAPFELAAGASVLKVAGADMLWGTICGWALAFGGAWALFVAAIKAPDLRNSESPSS